MFYRRKKNSALKKIAATIMTFIVTTMLTAAVYADDIGLTGGYPYQWTPEPSDGGWGWFCYQLNTPTNFYDYVSNFPDGGGESEGVGFDYADYELDSETTGEIEPSVGYALYYCNVHGYDMHSTAVKKALQHVVWASQRWGNESTAYGTHMPSNDSSYGGASKQGNEYDYIEYRATDFGNVYYYIIKPLKDGKVHFDVEPVNSEDLNVLVNQDDKTYTVGPYTLSLDITTDMIEVEEWAKKDANVLPSDEKIKNAKNTLYDEITNQDKIDDDAKFAWKGQLEGLNGKDVKYLNANGEEIPFPDFTTGEEFYIRFTDDSDEGIYEIGKPNVTVEFLDTFSGTTKVYKATALHIDEMLLPVANIKIHHEAEDSLTLDVEGTTVSKYSGKIKEKYHAAFVDISEPVYNSAPIRGYQKEIYVDATVTLTAKFKWTADWKLTEDMIGHYESDKFGSYNITKEMVLQQQQTEVQGFYSEEAIPNVTISVKIVGTPVYGTATNAQGQRYTYFKYYEYDYSNFDPGTTGWTVTKQNGVPTDKLKVDVTYDGKMISSLQPIVEFVTKFNVAPSTMKVKIEMPGRLINMQIGGLVWLESVAVKGVDENGMRVNGRYDDGEKLFAGIQVQLYELDGQGNATLKATTTTDAQGRYRFYGITGGGKPLVNAMKDYIVRFYYNGEMYQYTYYRANLSGGYSNAKDENRTAFNDIFDTISAYNENYAGTNGKVAYSVYQRLEDNNHNYIAYTGNQNYGAGTEYYGALRFIDVWEKFLELATYDDGSTRGEPQESDASKVWDREKKYADVYVELTNWLNNAGVSSTETTNVVAFIKDVMNYAWTYVDNQVLPYYNQFVIRDINTSSADYQAAQPKVFNFGGVDYTYLYNKTCDQSRNVDFGLYERNSSEVSLTKDVYKATVKVNGKVQEYVYDKRDNGASVLQTLLNNYQGGNNASELQSYLSGYTVKEMSNTYMVTTGGKTFYVDKSSLSVIGDEDSFNVAVRASDYALDSSSYSNNYSYTREVRKSEYLYDETDAYGTNGAKDLQVYVTYKIKVKNNGSYNVKVDEIVDYYDAKQYTFDGILNGDTYTPIEYAEYDENGNKTGSYHTTYAASLDSYGNIKNQRDIVVKTTSVTGRQNKLNDDYSALYLSGITSAKGNDYLAPNQYVTLFVTFKVNNNPVTGKVWLDQSLKTGETTIGKRNIAEINQYETYYTDGTLIPENLNADGTGTHTQVSGNTSTKAGKIDVISNPGNLSQYDLDENGMIKEVSGSDGTIDPLKDRTQRDASQAPNIKIIIDMNKDDNRVLTGYVFEDSRTVESDKAVVGNGVDENETKIDGVTVELVELVQNVDEYGTSIGTYSGEKVWGSVKYDFENASSDKLVYSETSQANPEDKTYYSGIGYSKIILQGSGDVLTVEQSLDYASKNGYYGFESVPAGDFYIRFIYGDTDRTVLTSSDSSEVNKLLKATGMNATSYNGQDYKSTVYQAGVNQTGLSYKAITGYTNYDTQNYTSASGVLNNGTDKTSMYLYDIARSEAVAAVSDAKDVEYYRTRSNKYSTGANGSTLLNNRAEVLASYYKLATAEASSNQRNMVDELESETYMVAQTGIINTEVEKNRTVTKVDSADTAQRYYLLNDIDLGLQQRPEAQLQLNKEVSNFKLTLADGQTLFNASKTVSGLMYDKHIPHVTYSSGSTYRLSGYVLGNNSDNKTPEIIQAQIDDELLEGAQMTIDYVITVANVGEVDYKDWQFYYTGVTKDTSAANISTTNAKTVVDYVTNSASYDATNQEADANWTTRTSKELTKSQDKDYTSAVKTKYEYNQKYEEDLVNREYYDRIETYNTLLTTAKLSGDLLPTMYSNDGNNSRSTTLRVTKSVSTSDENLVFNNLAEIVETSNEQGRRMEFSIVGNEKMAKHYDSAVSSEEIDDTTRVEVHEIDADSAQKVVLMPPTGENRNYTATLLAIIIAAAVILMSSYGMRRAFGSKNIL